MAENQPPTTPRDARAQAKADKAYQKAQRPWYKKKRFLIPLILIVLILIFVIATTVSGGGGNDNTGDPYAEPSTSEETGGTTQTSVSLTNGAADETVTYSVADWQLQNPAGAIANSTFGGSDTPLPSGQLVPGGTTSGDVCFNNDSGATGEFVLLYKPLTAFSSDRAAWVNTL